MSRIAITQHRPRFDYDVIVAGAGPGGTAIGSRLEQLGVKRTLLIDRAGFPRDKPCGGGLTGHMIEALAATGLTLDVPNVPAPHARVRYGGFERRVELARPVYVIRREEFDASLVAQVRARGIEVAEHEALSDFRVEDGGVTVITKKRTLRARVLVGADGAASVVRKRLRARDKVPIRLFRAEIPRPAGWADDEMLYDFSLMARGLRGYLWAFPVPDGRLNVGVMHYPPHGAETLSGNQLVELCAEGLAEQGLALGDGKLRGWPVWGYHPRAPVASPHVLTLGDAAGIDALTGEGIAVAMEQAVVAAAHVQQALASGDFAFAGYRRALRRATVGRELNLDRHLARLLYGGDAWRRWLSLVLFDPQVLELYAARVSGGLVLADQKATLWWSLVRHVGASGKRQRMLAEAEQATGDRRQETGDRRPKRAGSSI